MGGEAGTEIGAATESIGPGAGTVVVGVVGGIVGGAAGGSLDQEPQPRPSVPSRRRCERRERNLGRVPPNFLVALAVRREWV